MIKPNIILDSNETHRAYVYAIIAECKQIRDMLEDQKEWFWEFDLKYKSHK